MRLGVYAVLRGVLCIKKADKSSKTIVIVQNVIQNKQKFNLIPRNTVWRRLRRAVEVKQIKNKIYENLDARGSMGGLCGLGPPRGVYAVGGLCGFKNLKYTLG